MDCKLTDTYPHRDYIDPPPLPDPPSGFWDYLNKPFSMVCMDRHNGGINIVFADASARKVALKELWTLKWNPHFNTANQWTKAGGVKTENWRNEAPWLAGYPDY